MLTRRNLIVGGAAVVGVGALGAYVVTRGKDDPTGDGKLRPLGLRLGWFPQAEFAGYIVAKELGIYSSAGLDVTIRPGGPDIRAQNTVATGSDDIGIAPASQILLARSNGVPLKIVAQPVQDSIFRFVLKSRNRINSLADLKGQKIGLWLGGDEAEFIAMADNHGLTLRDFTVVPQDYTVLGFLQDQYKLSQVTSLNELIQIQAEGYEGEKLQILSPADEGVAMPSDSLFTTEKLIADRRPDLVKFLRATTQGWERAFSQKDETVKLLTGKYPDLKPEHQLAQLNEMERLMKRRDPSQPFGAMSAEAYATTHRVLVTSEQLKRPISPRDCFDSTFLAASIAGA